MKQIILTLAIAVAFVSCKEENKIIADLIVTNAKVAVMDNNKTFTEAIAVKNGKVLATGSSLFLVDGVAWQLHGFGRFFSHKPLATAILHRAWIVRSRIL